MSVFEQISSKACSASKYALAMSLFSLVPLDTSGDVLVKGMHIGMHIEQARVQAVTRIGDITTLSEIQPLAGGRSFFTINGEAGRIVANERERVEHIFISAPLAKILFGIAHLSKEHFAYLLGDLWGIEQSSWKERIEINNALEGVPLRSHIECYLPQQHVSISISQNNDLSISGIDIETIRRNIER